MSTSVRLRAKCACGQGSITFALLVYPSGREEVGRLYGALTEHLTYRNYLVDLDAPVRMPASGGRLHEAHGRWEIRCECGRHPLVAKSTKLTRALVLLHRHGRQELTLDELEALLSRV